MQMSNNNFVFNHLLTNGGNWVVTLNAIVKHLWFVYFSIFSSILYLQLPQHTASRAENAYVAYDLGMYYFSILFLMSSDTPVQTNLFIKYQWIEELDL